MDVVLYIGEQNKPIQLSWLEQLICNQQVVGSSPSIGSWGRYSSGQRGQTVNLLATPSQVRILFSPHQINGNARVAQLIERQPSKLRVAGLSPVSRSIPYSRCSSEVERFLGKEEVTGSIPVIGSEEYKQQKNEKVILLIKLNKNGKRKF